MGRLACDAGTGPLRLGSLLRGGLQEHLKGSCSQNALWTPTGTEIIVSMHDDIIGGFTSASQVLQVV